MAWTLAEGLVNQVVSYFTTNLAAKLAAIDAEVADGLVLAMPASIEISEKALKSVAEWPVMAVLVEGSQIPQWTGKEIWGHHSLVLGVIVLDQNEDTLKKRLYRYGRALVELLANAHGTGGITWEVGQGMIDIDFSPTFAGPEAMLIGDVQVTVPMILKETR